MKKVKLTTTLDLLREHQACTEGYRTLVKHIGADYPHDKPINLLTVLDSNGVQDMMWCLRTTQQDCLKQRYLICADMAESVLHLFVAAYPNDDRPAKAVKAARDAAEGKITPEEANNADDAAYAAYAAAYAAYAAYAAVYAADAADAAAYAADADAADGAHAAAAAAAYAYAGAGAAAYAAWRVAQADELRRISEVNQSFCHVQRGGG